MVDLMAYAPIIVFFAMGMGFGVAPLVLGHLFRPHNPNKEKCSQYECGFEPFESPHQPFNIRFYLVAILFIIFDLETTFLFPWAIKMKVLGVSGLWAMAVFLGLLTLGFVYEWRKGALQWL